MDEAGYPNPGQPLRRLIPYRLRASPRVVMHHVVRVAVEGFWETHDLSLNLFPEVTFLIGPNGTGKTTLINLIAAALTADFRTLDRIPFRRVVVTLNRRSLAEEPRITVTKSRRKDRPFDVIEYRFKSGERNAPELKFSLEDLEEQAFVRRRMMSARAHDDFYRFLPPQLNEKINELVTVNWLSVHRAVFSERSREDRSFESAVDQKLETISNELVRFFATLSRRKDEEVGLFQESVFVGLLERQSGTDFLDTSKLESLDSFVMALAGILKELHVSQANADQLLGDFEKTGNNIKRSIRRRNEPGFKIDDIVYLLGLRRISSIVDRWHKLQVKLSEIFAPRDKWLRIANELFQRKRMELTDSNELQFVSRTGKILKANMLSSGEKQLLILLSETLLQRERPAIFIADEPELSLHVLWQEKLVASLRALNPSAQIIAATHSPDIVGVLSDRAIDMETLIP